MHAHVSPGHSTPFDLNQLKRSLKSVIYYDRALIKIMPAERKQNEYCMPNTYRIPKWRALYDVVPQRAWGYVFDKCDKGNHIASIILEQELGKDASRYCFWNFQNLTDPGTVEFRGPPAVQHSAQAIHWLAVALGFVSNSVTKNWDGVKPSKAYPTSNNLRAAITSPMDPEGNPFSASVKDLWSLDVQTLTT